jgi:hypothetical protein
MSMLMHRLSSYWDVLTRPPPGTVVHLVRGERSDRWTPHMLQQLQEAEESWQEHAAEAPEEVGQLQVRRLYGPVAQDNHSQLGTTCHNMMSCCALWAARHRH